MALSLVETSEFSDSASERLKKCIMEKVHLLFMIIGPEVILTTSVHILLAEIGNTASLDAKRDGKYCPIITQHYAKRSLIFSG